MNKIIVKREVQRVTYYISDYSFNVNNTYEHIGEEIVCEYEPINTSFNKDDLIYIEELGQQFRILSKSISLNGDEICYITSRSIEDEVSKMIKEMCERYAEKILSLSKSNGEKREVIDKLTKGFWGKRKAKKLGVEI